MWHLHNSRATGRPSSTASSAWPRAARSRPSHSTHFGFSDAQRFTVKIFPNTRTPIPPVHQTHTPAHSQSLERFTHSVNAMKISKPPPRHATCHLLTSRASSDDQTQQITPRSHTLSTPCCAHARGLLSLLWFLTGPPHHACSPCALSHRRLLSGFPPRARVCSRSRCPCGARPPARSHTRQVRQPAALFSTAAPRLARGWQGT